MLKWLSQSRLPMMQAWLKLPRVWQPSFGSLLGPSTSRFGARLSTQLGLIKYTILQLCALLPALLNLQLIPVLQLPRPSPPPLQLLRLWQKKSKTKHLLYLRWMWTQRRLLKSGSWRGKKRRKRKRPRRNLIIGLELLANWCPYLSLIIIRLLNFYEHIQFLLCTFSFI